jgi:Cof subfamily protein (haloacid dehalogenase superfamily)
MPQLKKGGVKMKVLASDYDGTLRISELVSEEDKMAIANFRQAGNMFGIVTGRSMESLKMEIAKNQLAVDFIITNNGGVIYDCDGTLLECKYMDFNSALDIISYIKTVNCVSYVINDGFHRYKFSVDENQIDHKYGNIAKTTEKEEHVLDRGKIAQIVISLNDETLSKEIAYYINTTFKDYAIAYVNVHCVDIVPVGVSKGEALLYMETHLDLEHECIYSIGDSYNDLPMLQAFQGKTLTHAQDEIKEYGFDIYDSVKDCIDDLMKNA